jgi:hypothetical protein
MNENKLSIFNMLKSVFSLNAYYLTIHRTFNILFGEDQMLHYPLANKAGQSLICYRFTGIEVAGTLHRRLYET